MRSFAQILGHIADSQYSTCAVVRGVSRPEIRVEKTMTAKAEVVAALKESMEFCKPANADLTGAKGAEIVKPMGRDVTRLGASCFACLHAVSHHGNLVTYLHIQGIVPPTSEPSPKK